MYKALSSGTGVMLPQPPRVRYNPAY